MFWIKIWKSIFHMHLEFLFLGCDIIEVKACMNVALYSVAVEFAKVRPGYDVLCR